MSEGQGRTWGLSGGLDRPQLPPSRTGGHECAVLLGRVGRSSLLQAVLWGWAVGTDAGPPALPGQPAGGRPLLWSGRVPSLRPPSSPLLPERMKPSPALSCGRERVQGSRALGRQHASPHVEQLSEVVGGVRTGAVLRLQNSAELIRGLPVPRGSFALAFILAKKPAGATSRAASPRAGSSLLSAVTPKPSAASS